MSARFEDVRQARLDALGDLVADHLDTGAVAAAARARGAARAAVRPARRARLSGTVRPRLLLEAAVQYDEAVAAFFPAAPRRHARSRRR